MKTLLLFLSLVSTTFAQSFKDYRHALVAFEGYRNAPYTDSDGSLTVGIGHSLRGVTAKPHYSSTEIEQFYVHDLAVSLEAARRFLPHFDAYPLDVREVVLSLAFSCGPTGLSRFRDLRLSLIHHSYVLATNAIGTSKWFQQVSPSRANWAIHVMQRHSI